MAELVEVVQALEEHWKIRARLTSRKHIACILPISEELLANHLPEVMVGYVNLNKHPVVSRLEGFMPGPVAGR